MKKKQLQEPGVKEIARRARVSIGTVDRVLHNRPGVSAGTREKVNRIVEELNYRPNILARRLASKKLLEFNVLIPHISDESDYWQAPLNGVIQAEAELKPFGIRIGRYFFDQNDKASFVRQAALVLKQKSDGVLLAPFFLDESVRFVESCHQKNVPFVFINSDIPDQPCLSYIGPDLYQSGYLGGQLVKYGLKARAKILIVNISKEIKNYQYNRLLRKEEGFRNYFADSGCRNSIIKTDIRKTDTLSIERNLSELFAEHPDIGSVFVTNSRVGAVAGFMQKNQINNRVVVGYDLIADNLHYLKNGWIDFLICHRPVEQGYRSVMSLYRHIVGDAAVEQRYYMPIDIVSRENCDYYRN